MITENFKKLINKLKEKTEKSETLWLKSSGSEEFKLDLGKGAITIDNYLHPQSDIYFTTIEIYNERGDQIDKLSFAENEGEDFKSLNELYNLARREYYKVEKTFNDIFEELDSDKIIGTQESSDNNPF